MKPTKTCHIIRRLQRAIGSTDGVVRLDGVLETPFPDIDRCDFRDAYMLYNVTRKLDLATNSTDQKNKAYAKFLESEEACAKKRHQSIPSELDSVTARILLRAQQLISDILGPLDASDWYDLCEFTSGASTSRCKTEASLALKYDASIVPDVTPLALPYLLAWLAEHDVYSCFLRERSYLQCSVTPDIPSRPFYRIVPGAKLNFVPKDWDVFRVTLAEPDWNMFFQKGLGKYIRKRLRINGLDLNTDKKNQILAFAGSISGSLGTLDLKSASDSISIAVCRLLLPIEWFEVFYALRSPTYTIDGEWKTLQKMCSMGNGYTFELESMLFYSITQACIDVLKPADSRIAIFGDDIIVASEICSDVARVLALLGFELNSKKSFYGDVGFRESCGKHYKYGIDCTPVFVKKELDDPIYLQQFINQLCEWDGFPNGKLTDYITWLVSLLPVNYRNQIPVEIGYQGGLHHAELCSDPIRVVKHNRWGAALHFYEWVAETYDLTHKYDEWTLWLLRFMTGYSNPDGPMRMTVSDGRRLKRIKKVVSTARGAKT